MNPFGSISDVKRDLIAIPREDIVARYEGEKEPVTLRSCCSAVPKFHVTYQSGKAYLVCEKCIQDRLWTSGIVDATEVSLD